MSQKFPEGSKEASLFRKMLRNYETKQYKAGIKCSRNILDNHPNHGETIAMKALIVNAMDKRDEAFDLARTALKCDIRSGMCWHVLGILYRQTSDYEQALKSFLQAARIEPTNQTILRDLSHLQIQVRDYEGFRETRLKFLQTRGGVRASWLSYAVSQQLCGDSPGAVETIQEYLKLQDTNANAYELSEMYLYVVELLVTNGDNEAALQQLDKNADVMVDKHGRSELRAKALLNLGRKEEAIAVYKELIQTNPENATYYDKLEQAHGFDDTTPASERLAVYDAIAAQYPRCAIARVRPLHFLPADQLGLRLANFVLPKLRKGVPPLFKLISGLYTDPAKVEAIEKLLTTSIANLKQFNALEQGGQEESPAVLVWCLHFLAQHYDRLGKFDAALETIRQAINHTPTLVELYMIEGRILKHMGRLEEAAGQVNLARELDTADRFINSKAAKYLLRTGNVQEGQKIAGLFARETRNTNPQKQLRDMQCSWYEFECAKSFLAKGDVGNGLVHLHAVKSFYDQVVDDQFDFHLYALRKVNLRAYIRMLSYEDTAYFHHWYLAAAARACHLYANLHDHPYGSAKEREEQEKLAKMTESERKKYLSKQRKAAKKAGPKGNQGANGHGKGKQQQQQQQKKKKEAQKNKSKTPQWDPTELVQTKEPLEEAFKFLKPLLAMQDVPGMEQVLEPAFAVLLRRKRPLLMLKAVRAMKKTNLPRHVVLASTLQLLHCVEQNTDSLNPVVKEVLDEELPEVTEKKSAAEIEKELTHLASESLAAFVEQQHVLCTKGKCTPPEIFNNTARKTAEIKDLSLDEAKHVWLKLCNTQAVSNAGKCVLLKALRERFPDAHVFTQHTATTT